MHIKRLSAMRLVYTYVALTIHKANISPNTLLCYGKSPTPTLRYSRIFLYGTVEKTDVYLLRNTPKCMTVLSVMTNSEATPVKPGLVLFTHIKFTSWFDWSALNSDSLCLCVYSSQTVDMKLQFTQTGVLKPPCDRSGKLMVNCQEWR